MIKPSFELKHLFCVGSIFSQIYYTKRKGVFFISYVIDNEPTAATKASYYFLERFVGNKYKLYRRGDLLVKKY